MHKILVLQSDFGIIDGAVSAMIGVALSVDDTIRVFDLSHSITPFNIYEASYRLFQSMQYWPKGSVFVSVVDPGVGSERSSVAVLTNSGHIVVTPNNGSLSHLKRFIGLKEVHLIDVDKNRRQGAPNQSYTFDGRDLYAYVGARLASEIMTLDDVGVKIDQNNLIELALPDSKFENGHVTGCVEILDERYGSIWTSILVEDFLKMEPAYGESFHIKVTHDNMIVLQETLIYGRAFNAVAVGELVLYVSSLSRMAIAINQGNISQRYAIQTGLDWIVTITRK